jgi:hypothetical protein
MKLMDIALQAAVCVCILVVSSMNFLKNWVVFLLSNCSCEFLLMVYVSACTYMRSLTLCM